MELILASSSAYRRELLERLGLPFQVQAPRFDETPRASEQPEELARRLAIGKATTVAASHPSALVIGSDQVATCDGRLLSKPGSPEAARDQLRACSGSSARFLTGLAIVCVDRDFEWSCVEPFDVWFRNLSEAEIERYVDREQPLDCAGSFKAEGLGIALFQKLRGDDPTSLQGLPLIQLCGALRAAGLDPLLFADN
ncbi:MAG: nucleoside triphosphate pyrophosphatase [Pseudomonadota bacterium]